MRKGRWAALVAAPMAVALLATGCGGGSSADDQTVKLEWGEPENPLIPGNTTEANGADVLKAMFTGLVGYDPNTSKAYNAQAESITPSEGNRTFTIKLKPGWTFHDGSPVKAKNFVDTWNYTAYEPNGLQGASFFEQIEGFQDVHPEDPDGDAGPQKAPKPKTDKMSGLEVIDDTTFKVHLRQPLAIFPVMLGYNAYFPLPDKFFTDREGYEAHPIGNGPFKFKDRQPNINLTLTRFGEFKGEHKAKVENLEFKVYDNLDSAYQDLLSDNLDYIRQVPPSELTENRWKEDLGPRAQDKPGLMTTSIAFPLYDKRFDNPNLRHAISMAIDRKGITQSVYAGSREPADGYVPEAAEGYVPNQCGEYCTFNPKKAKELLAKAGGFKGKLVLESNADGGHKEWCEAVAASLRQNLGIEVAFVPTPTFSEFRQKVTAHEAKGLYRHDWVADYPNIESFLTQMYRTGASSNNGAYSNPKFDAALDKANNAPTIEAAEKLYAEAEKILVQDMPSIPLWSQPVQAGVSERAKDAIATPFRRMDYTSVTLSQ